MRIVEKSVVAVPPRVGLWREGSCQPGGPPAPQDPCLLPPRVPGPRAAYLRADAKMVVRDELGALVLAPVEPAVEGAEGHAGECQHEGQEAPGAACRGDRPG